MFVTGREFDFGDDWRLLFGRQSGDCRQSFFLLLLVGL